ncbi:hypothetical protein [Actinopolymorpha singaporensis]|uniref:Chromosome partitioning ATPase, Mrp family, contains Fe-S cluster n=1 Tax=Actinopolymorpha singaporensis TaxID=117157 RepID=A0A1H1L0X2_9ACTN|nr:hypothetical protein [Actinopolymorpha singaporensis]SDR68244.1 Chromosome partitioning ATPase, Mrp family, contains Fe-S cluster [Actinopolymorpha singaporensis]
MRDDDNASALTSFVLDALRRHLVLLVVLGVVFGAAGAGVALRNGLHYTASSSILLSPLQGNPYTPDGRGDQLVNLQTEAQLVGTNGVASDVRRRLHLSQSVEEIRTHVAVENPTNTQVLKVSYTARSSRDAVRGAQAFADSYLSYRERRANSIISSRLSKIHQQQTRTQRSLDELSDEMGRTDTSDSRRAYLAERLSALASQLASLESETSTLTASDQWPGQVISSAAPDSGTGPRDAIVLGGAGAVAGLLLGVALALLRTRVDPRLHHPYDVEHLGVQLLGLVGSGRRMRLRRSTTDPIDLSEPYRALRTSIITGTDVPPVTLTVTGMSDGIGAAPEAAGLAVGLARAGFGVAVVDTTGEVSRLLVGGGSQLPGLSELLAGIADLTELLVQPEDNLAVLPLGYPARQTMDQLLSEPMRATLTRLREWYDYVILCGPPAAGADGQALASLADGVVLVGAVGVTTRTELTVATAALEHVHAVLLGAVMVEGVSARRGGGGHSRRQERREERRGREAGGRRPAHGQAVRPRSPEYTRQAGPPPAGARPTNGGHWSSNPTADTTVDEPLDRPRS